MYKTHSNAESRAWPTILRPTIWPAFVLALLILTGACTGPPPSRSLSIPDIQEIREGEPAPADGYWISRPMLLRLYEAAERGLMPKPGTERPPGPGKDDVKPPAPSVPPPLNAPPVRAPDAPR